MNEELLLALDNAEQYNQQRRIVQNSLSHERRIIVNLIDGLSSYALPKTKNFADSDFSCSETPKTSDEIHINHHNYDIDLDFDSMSAIDCNETTETNDFGDNEPDENLILLEEYFSSKNEDSLTLHEYTNISTKEFCTNLVRTFRQANLCKTYSSDMLKLIHSAIPQPNNLPTSLNALLKYIQVQNLFIKRKVCLLCNNDIEYTATLCIKCKLNGKTHIVDIYDIDCDLVFGNLIERHIVDICKYREKILHTEYDEINNDIPFQKIYRSFLKTVVHNLFISALLHLDGISLGKSSKLKLWLLSCSILELPPHLRYQRRNMIVLSMWIGTCEPIMKIWLRECINNIKKLKSLGFFTRNGERWFIYFIGVIADCPAMKLALDHIGNNGYFACWFCKIEGVHIGNKRQYYFEEIPHMRTVKSYINESKEAEENGENVNGHLGVSLLREILDVPLPQASELRNLLLYALIPLFYEYMNVNNAAHVALFVCGIRMLHGPKLFGSKTSSFAHRLLSIYYKDHSKYYDGLENLVLHLHLHFSMQYDNYGSLNNTNCFGQESLLGSFSKNKHGTRYWGDLLAHYFSIDFALEKNIAQQNVDNVQHIEGAFDISNLSMNDVLQLSTWHKHICGCSQTTTCVLIFYRSNIRNQIYHSLNYPKRQSSVSYFVQYINDRRDSLFGSIEYFFTYKDSTFALINNHPIQKPFSDVFASSYYYPDLSKYINSYFYILQSYPSAIHYVPIEKILNLCIVFEKDNFIIVTPISQGYEHD